MTVHLQANDHTAAPVRSSVRRARRPVRLLIVEGSFVLAERLRAIAAYDARVALQGTARTAHDAMRLIERTRFELALVDTDLPDAGGPDVIRHVIRKDPSIEVIAVAKLADVGTMLEAIEAGANGLLLKGEIGPALIDAIMGAYQGGSMLSPSMARLLIRQFVPHPEAPQTDKPTRQTLTQRESEVLRLMAQGHTVTEMGAKMLVSSHTISSHAKNLYGKLNVTSRGQAIHEGYLRGLLSASTLRAAVT